ncbi:DDE-type integrase/transposase/recombinase [Elizabethkingia anophelis]|nr:DDE-type integrase/transposase/recombinase [Elizabethkingia anophelis]
MEGTLRALKWLGRIEIIKKYKSLINHSDGGLQCCLDEYQFLLKKYDIKCSMRQNFYPYENAIVERVNGVLKQEFNIDNMHLDLPII